MEQTAGPTILRSPIPQATASQMQKDPSGWFKKNAVRIIIAVLILGVIGEVIFGGISLISPSAGNKLNLLAPRVNGLGDAILSLVPNKKSYRSGDEVIVDVKLFTGGYSTDSTDLVIKYDPAFLAPKSQGFAVAGSLYSEYPALQVDNQKGLIGISGITVPGKESFSGAGSFAKLYFKALKDGQTQVSIDFVKDATADSNVVVTGSSKDILGLVKNADILISGSDTEAPVTNNQSCKTFKQACINSAGNTGVQICEGGSTKEGSCGYDSEFTMSCGACVKE